MMLKLKKTEWFILIGLLFLSFVPSVGGLFRLIELGLNTGLDFMPENPRVQSAPAPVVFHIVFSFLFCIVGAFQFLPSIRNNFPQWHRRSGWVIVVSGIVSTLSGMWMAYYYTFPDSLQGNLLYVVRIVVGITMTMCIVFGLLSVLQKQIAYHQAWMIRAYALGVGAGTQGFILTSWMIAVGEPSGLTRDVLMTLSWVINLLVAEWIVCCKQQSFTLIKVR